MKKTGQIVGALGLILCTVSAIWLRYFVVTASQLDIGFLLLAVGAAITGIGVALFKLASSRKSNRLSTD